MNINVIAQKRIQELERENARLRRERDQPMLTPAQKVIAGQAAIQRLEVDYPVDSGLAD